MADIHLSQLRLLVKIYELGSISKAAEAVGLSQPAASLSLSRLRKTLDDPLFVRGNNKMLPTARCVEVVNAALTIIHLLEERIKKSVVFDPLTAKRTFHLTLYDIGEMVFLPKLLAYMSEAAPGCNIVSKSLPASKLPEALESVDIELAVGFFPNLERPSFYAQRLFEQKFVVLARKEHPLINLGEPLSLDRYLQMSHIVVQPLGRTNRLFDNLVESKGITRNIQLSTPHFMSVPSIVASTNLVATVPIELASDFLQSDKLCAVKPPVNSPIYTVKQYWHARYQTDPGLQWLRRTFVELFATQPVVM